MRLLILGTGGMAKNQADQFSRMDNVEIVAAVDTDALRLAAFADQFSIPKRFASLDEAIASQATSGFCEIFDQLDGFLAAPAHP